MIVDIFGDIVKKVEAKVLSELQTKDNTIKGVFYEYGHYREIKNTLDQKEGSKNFFDKKYPLVALFEDVKETTLSNGAYEVPLTIVICFNTKEDAKSSDRRKEVIYPILEPIYKALVKEINRHPKFVGYNTNLSKTIRPYWGIRSVNSDGVESIFNDVLDAIELNLKLKYFDNCIKLK